MNSDNNYNQYIKLQIYPNSDQKEYLDKCINISRFIYNWALGLENKQYELYKNGKSNKQFLTEKDLRKLYNEFSKENPWTKELGLESARYQISRVEYAFSMFFKHYNEHPKFKRKKIENHLCSYTIRHDRFYLDHDKVRIPGFKRGILIDCKYNPKISKYAKYHGVRLIRDNLGSYFVAFHLVREKPIIKDKSNKIIGIDLNGRANRRFVCSDGSIFKGRDTTSIKNKIQSYLKKLSKDRKRLKELEKTNPEAELSNRARKRIYWYRKANRKIANIEENDVQLFTKRVIDKKPSKVVMETLDLRNYMKKKPYIEKYIHYIPLFRFREVMEYKCNKFGIDFELAPKDYPSSQICSKCGNIKKIWSQKTYICPICGNRMDRDINAAINLANYSS